MRKIFTRLLFPFFMVSFPFGLRAEPELKGTAPELSQFLATVPKTIVIEAEADLHVPADHAVVGLTVTTESRSLSEALRLNREVRGKLLNYLKEHGVPNDRVTASRFSSTPKFGLFGEKAKSYRVENLVKVSVQDEREFQTVATAVDSLAEVQFTGVEFEHKDKEALRQKAISQACDNAIGRRKMFEDKLGLSLKLEKFSVTRLSQGAASDFSRRAYAGDSAKGILGVSTGSPANEESVSTFGELVITVQVSFEYSIQPK